MIIAQSLFGGPDRWKGGSYVVKISWSAGHGMNTLGKRSPHEEREWSFNNKVVDSGMLYLAKYDGVQQIRVDDPSGILDIPLSTRTNLANEWGADIYISSHHNSLEGFWGNHSGVETYTFGPPENNPKSVALAQFIHPLVVRAMGLKDRGIKTANFHELRETNMPAVLVEGGFMDSNIDIIKLRNDTVMKSQGEAIAKGIVAYFDLKLKKEEMKLFKTESLTLNHEFTDMLVKAREKGFITSEVWENKAAEGTLTESEAIGLTAIVVKRMFLNHDKE